MPINKKFLAEFEPSSSFHIYNRTNNKELLFFHDGHRSFFLKRYSEILSPFCDTFAWILLPNHFHLLIRVKSLEDILLFLNAKDKQTIIERKFLKKEILFGELIENSFKRWFQSYAQSFNADQTRSGNLFYRPFKRVLIESDEQFTKTLIYIHANAVKHALTEDFTKYKWSSWQSLLSNQSTKLLRSEVLDWFGSIENFIKVHLESSKYYYNTEKGLEE